MKKLNSTIMQSDYTETPHETKKNDRDVQVSSMKASIDSNNMKLNMDTIMEHRDCHNEVPLGLSTSSKAIRYGTNNRLEECGNRYTIASTDLEADEVDKIETVGHTGRPLTIVHASNGAVMYKPMLSNRQPEK